MLTEAYVDALLVDEDLADLVWEVWDARVINDEQCAIAWLSIVTMSEMTLMPTVLLS